jgi:hypothetical protein
MRCNRLTAAHGPVALQRRACRPIPAGRSIPVSLPLQHCLVPMSTARPRFFCFHPLLPIHASYDDFFLRAAVPRALAAIFLGGFSAAGSSGPWHSLLWHFTLVPTRPRRWKPPRLALLSTTCETKAQSAWRRHEQATRGRHGPGDHQPRSHSERRAGQPASDVRDATRPGSEPHGGDDPPECRGIRCESLLRLGERNHGDKVSGIPDTLSPPFPYLLLWIFRNVQLYFLILARSSCAPLMCSIPTLIASFAWVLSSLSSPFLTSASNSGMPFS